MLESIGTLLDHLDLFWRSFRKETRSSADRSRNVADRSHKRRVLAAALPIVRPLLAERSREGKEFLAEDEPIDRLFWLIDREGSQSIASSGQSIVKTADRSPNRADRSANHEEIVSRAFSLNFDGLLFPLADFKLVRLFKGFSYWIEPSFSVHKNIVSYSLISLWDFSQNSSRSRQILDYSSKNLSNGNFPQPFVAFHNPRLINGFFVTVVASLHAT